MTTEEWRPVADFPDYSVSNTGRVISYRGRREPRELVGTPNSNGYLQVVLCGDKRRRAYVHHLVAEAFIGPRPEGLELRHLDGDRSRNAADNLAYGTHSQNMQDQLAHGTHSAASRTHCPQRHPYDGENTYVWHGRRYCRQCKRVDALARYHARRAA